MYIKHNQGTHQSSLQNVEILSDNRYHSCDKLLHECFVSMYTVFLVFGFVKNCLGNALSPFYEVNQQNVLGVEGEKPVFTVEWILIWILLECLFG